MRSCGSNGRGSISIEAAHSLKPLTSSPPEVKSLLKLNTTDPDQEDQYITEWEFSYTVNGHFAGALDGAENIRSNSLHFDAEMFMDQLILPGPGSLQPGNVIEFRLWARDNHNIELEQFHRFVLAH